MHVENENTGIALKMWRLFQSKGLTLKKLVSQYMI